METEDICYRAQVWLVEEQRRPSHLNEGGVRGWTSCLKEHSPGPCFDVRYTAAKLGLRDLGNRLVRLIFVLSY